MRTVVYPGTFDPITYGHVDIIERGSHIFEELIVAVAVNPQKTPLFSIEERMDIIRKLTAGIKNVRVDSFQGMTVDYVLGVGSHIILRGMRTMSDFENEFQLALSNKALCADVETVFLMTSVQRSFYSSHRIKEVVAMGADARPFVPDIVADKLEEKFGISRG